LEQSGGVRVPMDFNPSAGMAMRGGAAFIDAVDFDAGVARERQRAAQLLADPVIGSPFRGSHLDRMR